MFPRQIRKKRIQRNLAILLRCCQGSPVLGSSTNSFQAAPPLSNRFCFVYYKPQTLDAKQYQLTHRSLEKIIDLFSFPTRLKISLNVNHLIAHVEGRDRARETIQIIDASTSVDLNESNKVSSPCIDCFSQAPTDYYLPKADSVLRLSTHWSRGSPYDIFKWF